MKINELIVKLTELQKIHGDNITVKVFEDGRDYAPVAKILVDEMFGVLIEP